MIEKGLWVILAPTAKKEEGYCNSSWVDAKYVPYFWIQARQFIRSSFDKMNALKIFVWLKTHLKNALNEENVVDDVQTWTRFCKLSP